MSESGAAETPVFEPPLDHDELCARLRFSFDEPVRLASPAASERAEAQRAFKARLRSCALRITKTLTPDLFALVDATCQKLLITEPPEVYVTADPTLNAFALPGEGRAFVMLHSALVERLTPGELAFVLGHELGHAGMRHDRPTPDAPRELLFSLEQSRAAELSADRMGLVAAPDVKTALSAALRVASGLGHEHVRFDVDAFLCQLEEAPQDVAREWEAVGRHPELPFRFRALQQFAKTDIFASLAGLPGGQPFAQVEAELEEQFVSIGDGVAFIAASDHVHEAVAWLGIQLVTDDGIMAEGEYRTLVQLVGEIWAEDVATYTRRHGLDAVRRRAADVLGPLAFSGLRSRDRVTRALLDFGRVHGREKKARELVAEAKAMWRAGLAKA